MESAALLGLAGAYALVNGLNDGGALTGVGVTESRLRPITVVALLVAALVVVPLAGAPVAATLASRLVDFDAGPGTTGLVVAVVVAVAVTGGLAWAGLPTSLTLATVGAFVGVGLGTGLTVSAREVVRVGVLAAAAPVAGGLVAFALLHLARLGPVARLGRAGGPLRTVTTTLVALAYAANDGQKMIAVAVIASGAEAASAGRPGLGLLAALAAVFAVGAVAGMRRGGIAVGRGVLAARPTYLAASELASAGAVAATGALGAPVSMTQSLAGALAGSGFSASPRRVRWRLASRLAVAWALTLPLALVAALAAAALAVRATGGGA